MCQYANKIRISQRTLSSLTFKLLEKSPLQIIDEKIISEAKKMMVNDNFTIKEISDDLGFSAASYFVKYFKRHTDISPVEFRKMEHLVQ